MKISCKILLLLPLVLLFPVTEGTAAPDVRLEHLDGDKRPIADYIGQGRWTIINIWSPTCSACLLELPTLRKFQKQHPEVDVIGVTIDFPSFDYAKRDILENYLKRDPLDYPIFLADMELASKVIGNRLVAIPLIAIVHPDGEVLARWPGEIEIAEIEEFIANHEKYTNDDPLSFD